MVQAQKFKYIMCWFSSDEGDTSIEQKNVDSAGHVNNNIVIQEARDIHQQSQTSELLLAATCFLCAMEVIKMIIYFYTNYTKKLKKKYQSSKESNA